MKHLKVTSLKAKLPKHPEKTTEAIFEFANLVRNHVDKGPEVENLTVSIHVTCKDNVVECTIRDGIIDGISDARDCAREVSNACGDPGSAQISWETIE